MSKISKADFGLAAADSCQKTETRPSLKRRTMRAALIGAHRVGLFSRLRRHVPNTVSILAYHRIADPARSDFFGFPWNVSATPETFEEQLDYIKSECNVLSLAELQSVIKSGLPMPENAVVITFDDGYLDNYTIALPALVRRNLPAVLFATTGFIDGFASPFWDWVTQAFLATEKEAAKLPMLGRRSWASRDERMTLANEWIKHGIDHVPHAVLRRAIAELAGILQHPLPLGAPPSLMMSWDQLASMSRSGFDIGAHTVTHPVLLQTNTRRAELEIHVSKAIIERQTGQTVSAFAYPNGLFSPQHERILAGAGYKMGFRVDGGLTFRREIAVNPFAIRRSCVTLKDDIPRFAAKIAGLARLQ